VRIAVSYQGPDILALDVDALWLNVHIGVAIISACLPTQKPLVISATNKARSYYSQMTSSKFTSSSESSKNYKAYTSDGYGRASKGNKDSSKAWASLDSLRHNEDDNIKLVDREAVKANSAGHEVA
jgi:hypothetical protein